MFHDGRDMKSITPNVQLYNTMIMASRITTQCDNHLPEWLYLCNHIDNIEQEHHECNPFMKKKKAKQSIHGNQQE